MTSFILRSIQDRPPSYPTPSNLDQDCTFCRIIQSNTGTGKGTGTGQGTGAWVVYEDEDVLAFLDIYPLRPGHTLLIPKTHIPRLADLPPKIGGKMGEVLPRVVRAVCEATGNPDLNVVCNQGYAQAVHVHWHLIPAPTFASIPTPTLTTSDLSSKKKNRNSTPGSKPPSNVPPTHKFMLRGEMANRDFLDDDQADELVREIKSRL